VFGAVVCCCLEGGALSGRSPPSRQHLLEVQEEERCPCEPVQESNTLYAGLGFELCSIRISWETAV
jgi:hypothetical protein